MIRYFQSLFAKPRHETLIRKGVEYRITYKGHRVVKEEAIDTHGGFTGLSEVGHIGAVTDRKRTDLDNRSTPRTLMNFTKQSETL